MTTGGFWLPLATAAPENFPDTTEALEALNHAQENLAAVAENSGLLRTWLEDLCPIF